MSPSNELAHLRTLNDMRRRLNRGGVGSVLNSLIYLGVFAALTYGATSNWLLSITVGLGVRLMLGVGERVVDDILQIEMSRTIMFFSGTEEQLESFLKVEKILAQTQRKFF